MNAFCAAAAALLMSTLLGLHDAAAFTVDNRTGNNTDGSVRSGFTDPDDALEDRYGATDAQPSLRFWSNGNGAATANFMDQDCSVRGDCRRPPLWR